MKLVEIRKEDDIYYQGAFWIDGKSVADIKHNNFNLIGIKLESDYEGNYLNYNDTQKALTHKRLWDKFNKDYPDKPYNYLPRGRVAIYNGVAYIHLNSLFNQPSIIDAIVREYGIDRLEIDIDLNDTYQGGHYDFLLK